MPMTDPAITADARCLNDNCRKTFQYNIEVDSPPLACSPECKEIVEEEWAEEGNGFLFPHLHSRDMEPVPSHYGESMSNAMRKISSF